MIKTFDLFAGIGGFRYASEKVFKKNKIENLCVGWSEIDKYCQITYKSNYNLDNTYFIDDIKKITGNNNNFCNQNNYNSLKKKIFIKNNLCDFDLLFAGFPCQSFSAMGKQQGLNDERGALFFDIAAILHSKKPKYFILENVKRLLTIDNKKTFKTIISILEKENYDVSWWLLDSKDYGVPQTRRRVFIYGSLKKDNNNFPIDPPSISKKIITTKSILEKNTD